jgi:uncharacterized membrane protein affecting hemolysin expression
VDAITLVISLVVSLAFGIWFAKTMTAIRRSREEIRDSLVPKKAAPVDQDDQRTQRLVELLAPKGQGRF